MAPKTAKKSAPEGVSPQEKLASVRQEMKAQLVERDDEVDLVLTALVAGEHPLLVGPPGTAKSLLLDGLLQAMPGATRFNILLNKFTTPEEVFGPVSVQGLKNDEYRRITAGKLPEADLAFVDEVFKASSAILNTMLRILNERMYDNGGSVTKCPLQMCVAASNEWPGDDGQGKELGALFDRFLFRKTVRPVRGKDGLKRLLWENSLGQFDFEHFLTPTEVGDARFNAEQLNFSQEAEDAFMEIVRQLREEGIHPGDRRLRKSVGAVKAFAFLEGLHPGGGDRVQPAHLEVLQHTLWDDPQEQPEKCAKIVLKVANPVGMQVTDLMNQAADVSAKCAAVEAVPKLQSIEKQLAKLPADRAGKARQFVQRQIKEQMNKVIGVED